MARFPSLSFVATLAAIAPAQSTATVPAVCATMPGNAALSLPFRWSHGLLQMRIAQTLLPAALQGHTITGVRLRRPTMLTEPAYPAVQRTVTVRGSFQGDSPGQMTVDAAQNRLTGVQTLFGPAVVNVQATPLPGPQSVFGQEVAHFVFSQPLPVQPGTLFLEFETNDPPLQVASTNWVDAVWFPGGVETGYVVSVGDGSCTTRPDPTVLRWNDSVGPQAGATAKFEVLGAPPTSGSTTGLLMLWMGIDPQGHVPGPAYLGFGGSFGLVDAGLTGCFHWAPLDVPWTGLTDAAGKFTTTFPLNNVPAGIRIGVQALWLDSNRPGLPFSFSNGLVMVLNSVAVGGNCATSFFPAGATVSPWQPFLGQMPVLTLDYQ